jgi:restriction system protein
MAKRRRQSPAEDFIDVIALAPWWVGVAVALVGYLVLHALAQRPISQPPLGSRPADYANSMWTNVFTGLATFGQYAVPVLSLAGAAISALKRRQHRGLLGAAQQGGGDTVRGLSWQDFERLIGEAFRQRGYAVAERGGSGADGGVDLVLTRDRERYLVQCKQWRAIKVGVPVVRELYGAMAAEGAVGGFVVTAGRFTAEAKAFASGRNVELIDGAGLDRLLAPARSSAAASRATAAPAPSLQPVPSDAPPSCPRCGRAMVERTARRGANAGQRFWGCSAYPGCKGVVEIGRS